MCVPRAYSSDKCLGEKNSASTLGGKLSTFEVLRNYLSSRHPDPQPANQSDHASHPTSPFYLWTIFRSLSLAKTRKVKPETGSSFFSSRSTETARSRTPGFRDPRKRARKDTLRTPRGEGTFHRGVYRIYLSQRMARRRELQNQLRRSGDQEAKRKQEQG